MVTVKVSSEGQIVLPNLRKLSILFVDVDERLSLIAGRVRAFHKLSYASTFAVATAMDLNATLLTGDEDSKAWRAG